MRKKKMIKNKIYEKKNKKGNRWETNSEENRWERKKDKENMLEKKR